MNEKKPKVTTQRAITDFLGENVASTSRAQNDVAPAPCRYSGFMKPFTLAPAPEAGKYAPRWGGLVVQDGKVKYKDVVVYIKPDALEEYRNKKRHLNMHDVVGTNAYSVGQSKTKKCWVWAVKFGKNFKAPGSAGKTKNFQPHQLAKALEHVERAINNPQQAELRQDIIEGMQKRDCEVGDLFERFEHVRKNEEPSDDEEFEKYNTLMLDPVTKEIMLNVQEIKIIINTNELQAANILSTTAFGVEPTTDLRTEGQRRVKGWTAIGGSHDKKKTKDFALHDLLGAAEHALEELKRDKERYTYIQGVLLRRAGYLGSIVKDYEIAFIPERQSSPYGRHMPKNYYALVINEKNQLEYDRGQVRFIFDEKAEVGGEEGLTSDSLLFIEAAVITWSKKDQALVVTVKTKTRNFPAWKFEAAMEAALEMIREDTAVYTSVMSTVTNWQSYKLESTLRMLSDENISLQKKLRSDVAFRSRVRYVRRYVLNSMFGSTLLKKPDDASIKLVTGWLGKAPDEWANELVRKFTDVWLPKEYKQKEPKAIFEEFAGFFHLDEIVPLAAADFSIPEHLRIFHAENSQLLPASVNMSKSAKYYEADFVALVYPAKEWLIPEFPKSSTDTLTIDGEKIERGERRREPIGIRRPQTVENSLPFPHHKKLNFDKKKWLDWVLAQQSP